MLVLYIILTYTAIKAEQQALLAAQILYLPEQTAAKSEQTAQKNPLAETLCKGINHVPFSEQHIIFALHQGQEELLDLTQLAPCNRQCLAGGK